MSTSRAEKATQPDGTLAPGTVVLIHQAPVLALIVQAPTGTGAQIWTPVDTYECVVGGEAGKGRCEHSGPSETARMNAESWAGALNDQLSSGRQLDPFAALHELEGVIRDVQPEVIKSTRTYAGQQTTCVKTIVRIHTEQQSVQGENEACFTVHGIVAFTYFGVIGKDRTQTYSYELTRYSESVDPARLKPPAGATIVEA